MDNRVAHVARDFRVRFAQVDSAHVIYYPRYFEIIADTFPEIRLDVTPCELAVRFLRANRLGDDLRLHLDLAETGWKVSGRMGDQDHFTVELSAGNRPMHAETSAFIAPECMLGDWQCDPRGQLHVSRYFELLSHAVEQWFENSLGSGFNELHVQQGMGIPTVQFDTRLRALPRTGDTVVAAVSPVSVGRSAVTLEHALARAGETLAITRQVIVFVQITGATIRPVPVPEPLRRAMTAQLAGRRRQ